MASPLSKVDQDLIAENFEHRLRRRAFAAWFYYTGQGKRRWEEQTKKEKQPWRILRYSHIADPEKVILPLQRSDFTLPKTLEYHCYYLKRNFNVIPLTDLIDKIESKKAIPNNTVCITFDGGYKDFYLNAFPLLQKFDLPATIFLPTAFIGTKQLFWTDKVVLAMSVLSYLSVPFPEFSNLPNNFFEVLESLSTRRRVTAVGIALFIDALFEMPPAQRIQCIVELGQILESSGAIPAVDNFLSWEQVQQMNHDSRITFGSMSDSHNALTELSESELANDLQMSFDKLASFRHISSTLSLPYGYTDEDVEKKLKNLSCKYFLSREPLPTTDPQIKPSLLGRVSLFEDSSFCTEFLASRIWNISIGRYKF